MRFEVYETSEGRVPYLDWFDGQIVLLLGGSGKRNQDREIAQARARLKDFEQRTK